MKPPSTPKPIPVSHQLDKPLPSLGHGSLAIDTSEKLHGVLDQALPLLYEQLPREQQLQLVKAYVAARVKLGRSAA